MYHLEEHFEDCCAGTVLKETKCICCGVFRRRGYQLSGKISKFSVSGK